MSAAVAHDVQVLFHNASVRTVEAFLATVAGAVHPAPVAECFHFDPLLGYVRHRQAFALDVLASTRRCDREAMFFMLGACGVEGASVGELYSEYCRTRPVADDVTAVLDALRRGSLTDARLGALIHFQSTNDEADPTAREDAYKSVAFVTVLMRLLAMRAWITQRTVVMGEVLARYNATMGPALTKTGSAGEIHLLVTRPETCAAIDARSNVSRRLLRQLPVPTPDRLVEGAAESYAATLLDFTARMFLLPSLHATAVAPFTDPCCCIAVAEGGENSRGAALCILRDICNAAAGARLSASQASTQMPSLLIGNENTMFSERRALQRAACALFTLGQSAVFACQIISESWATDSDQTRRKLIAALLEEYLCVIVQSGERERTAAVESLAATSFERLVKLLADAQWLEREVSSMANVVAEAVLSWAIATGAAVRHSRGDAANPTATISASSSLVVNIASDRSAPGRGKTAPPSRLGITALGLVAVGELELVGAAAPLTSTRKADDSQWHAERFDWIAQRLALALLRDDRVREEAPQIAAEDSARAVDMLPKSLSVASESGSADTVSGDTQLCSADSLNELSRHLERLTSPGSKPHGADADLVARLDDATRRARELIERLKCST